MKYIIVSFISQLSAGEWFPVVSIRFPIVSNSVTVYFQSDSEITLFATIPLQQKSTMHYSVLFDSFSYIYIYTYIYISHILFKFPVSESSCFWIWN